MTVPGEVRNRSVVHVYPFFAIGGSEEVGLTLMAHQARQGWQPYLAAIHSADPRCLEEAACRGLKTHNWSVLSMDDRVLALRDCLRSYDMAHFHLSYDDGVVGRALEVAPQAATVCTCHLPNVNLSRFRNVDAVVSCCGFVESRVMLPQDAGEAMTVLNGTDVPLPGRGGDTGEAKRRFGLDPRDYVLGRMARLDVEKFPEPAYRVLAGALSRVRQAVAVVVGEGNARSRIESLAQRDGLSGRILLPGASRDRLGWLAAFDQYVYYSEVDALPLSVIEAMGAGLPVVATRNAGLPELIEDGVNGMLVDHGDWEAMVETISRLHEDRDFAEALGRSARDTYLARFTGEAMWRQYADAYEHARQRRSERLRRTVGTVVSPVPQGTSPGSGAAAARQPRLEIVSWETAYGTIGLAGDLGYERKRVSLEVREGATVVSAHGPSAVVVYVPQEARVSLSGALDNDTLGRKVAARFTVDGSSGERLADLGVAVPGRPTAVSSVVLPAGEMVALRCTATTRDWCHSVWVIEGSEVVQAGPDLALDRLTAEVASLAREVPRGEPSAHELYVQTYGSRAPMALRCIASHLVSCREPPWRVVLVSFDDVSSIASVLPEWCEVWSRPDRIGAELRSVGLSERAVAKVLAENMFAKYAIPRLAMGDRVLVCDDDVLWAGPCDRMFRSKRDYVYLEDPPGCYGERSIDFFKGRGLVDDDADGPPMLCAGVYLMNSKAVSDSRLVSEIIEAADSHRDEQSAVAMESRMPGKSYEVVGRPLYVHGGHGPLPIPAETELLHMQGYLMPVRMDSRVQARLVAKSILCRGERLGGSGRRGPRGTAFAVCIPVSPGHAELLNMNLERAREVGALEKAQAVLVVEDEPRPSERSSVIREMCGEYGVTHEYSEEAIGHDLPQQTRMVIRCLHRASCLAPDADWIIRMDADVVLVGDAWSHIVGKGMEQEADVCANIRPDGRFGPEGYVISPCAAFSASTCRDIFSTLESKEWSRIETALHHADDVDTTLVARLLGKRIVASEGRPGYITVRDLCDVRDERFWAPETFEGTLAIHIAGGFDKHSRMKAALDRIRHIEGHGPSVRSVSGNAASRVSVLTCCYRFLQRFRVFLSSLRRQVYPRDRLEIVVTNPGSPDGLHEYLGLARLAAAKAVRDGDQAPTILEVEADPRFRRNRGYLINRAFERSSGEIVMVADCDCVLPPHFLERAVEELLRDRRCILGVYRNFLSPETTAMIVTGQLDPVEAFETLRLEDNEERLGYRGVLGYCQIVTREAFSTVMYPEEFDTIDQSDVAFVERLAQAGIRSKRLRGETVLHLHHERNWEGVDGFM